MSRRWRLARCRYGSTWGLCESAIVEPRQRLQPPRDRDTRGRAYSRPLPQLPGKLFVRPDVSVLYPCSGMPPSRWLEHLTYFGRCMCKSRSHYRGHPSPILRHGTKEARGTCRWERLNRGWRVHQHLFSPPSPPLLLLLLFLSRRIEQMSRTHTNTRTWQFSSCTSRISPTLLGSEAPNRDHAGRLRMLVSHGRCSRGISYCK